MTSELVVKQHPPLLFTWKLRQKADMNTSFQVPHVSRLGLLQQSTLFYEFEYKSTPPERLMLGEELIGDVLSMLFTGCLSLKTLNS